MLALAVLLGGFSYVLFFIGVLGLFYKNVLVVLSVAFVLGILMYFRKYVPRCIGEIKKIKFNKLGVIVLLLLTSQAIINVIGALGPELSFDALWYHLTLAKLYLLNHQIIFLPGGVLYYSAMPKTAELLFSAVLAFGPESLPKLLHFFIGIASCILMFKFSRRFVNVQLALLCVLVFYSNLVVGWESISGYIDLVRVFFEGASLYAFFLWVDSRKTRWFFLSAVLVGFALTTKLLAISSVVIFVILALFILRQKASIKKLIAYEMLYFIIVFLIPLPWFIFSYVNTGNPFYPFFSEYFTHLQNSTLTYTLLNPLHIITKFWNFFLRASDPISPVYFAILPVVVVYRKQFSSQERLLLWYTILGIVLWYFVSGIEGTRIALPYIFSFSVVVGVILQKIMKNHLLYKSLLLFVILVAIISIGYRGIANAKFIPVIMGKESKATFLAKHLNFSFGDWVDADGYMARKIKPTDTVLLYGYHNLYYVDFPYVHDTWVKKGDKFNYIAIDRESLPARFKDWKLVYQNSTTHIHLYSDGGEVWTY